MRHFLPIILSILPLAACAGVRDDAAQAQLPSQAAQGRHLFLSRCARCHALPDPAKCDAGIMDSMAPQSGLTSKERAAVEAYVARFRK